MYLCVRFQNQFKAVSQLSLSLSLSLSFVAPNIPPVWHTGPLSQWRYARLAPGVRRRALRAQRELVARYNREAVARLVMRRLRAIARRLE